MSESESWSRRNVDYSYKAESSLPVLATFSIPYAPIIMMKPPREIGIRWTLRTTTAGAARPALADSLMRPGPAVEADNARRGCGASGRALHPG